MNDDARRGLPSASKMERLANCPGSSNLENNVRSSGHFFELRDPSRLSGIQIHQYLALEALGGTAQAADFFTAMSADERATASMCIELRNRILSQWKAQH